MASFRFCRPDDIPLLVNAINKCYNIHFPQEPMMSVTQFRKEADEINLWASSCMLILENEEPIGVLIVARRQSMSLITRIGFLPQFTRMQYGSQVLDSLKKK